MLRPPKLVFKGTSLSLYLTAKTVDGRKYSSRGCRNVLDEKEPTKETERIGNVRDTPRFMLSFPFKGTLKKTDKSGVDGCVPEPAFTVYKGNSGDTSGGRTYFVHCGDEVLSLPSVTTVLSLTLSKKRNFMLNNWKKGIVKEYGEVGYRQVKNEIKAAGNDFHVELESKLYRPHLLSIKPMEHRPLTSLGPVSCKRTTISSLPQPIPFPSNHTIPAVENDTQDVNGGKAGNLVSQIDEKDIHSDRNTVQALPQSDSKVDVSSAGSSGYLESVNPVLDDISEIHSLESVVAHLELGYSGTCDCIATYRDTLCLIDWKTSSKPRPTITDLHDYPLQAVAYAGAVNQDPHYPFKVENVLIVTAYPSGDPCHAHLFPSELCETYWDKWLLRLLQYQTLFSSDLSDVC